MTITSIFFLTLNQRSYSQQKIDCASAKTQIEINTCLQNQFNKADKDLNLLYKKISAKLNVQQKTVFVQSQKKWISFRDEYAKVYSLIYEGGQWLLERF